MTWQPGTPFSNGRRALSIYPLLNGNDRTGRILNILFLI